MTRALATATIFVALLSTTPRGQETAPGGTASTNTAGAASGGGLPSDGRTPPNTTPSVGAGRPVLIIPATSDSTGDIRLQLPLPSAAVVGELEIGPLTSTGDSSVRITPRLDLLGTPLVIPGENLVSVPARVSGLFPFGESSAPIFRNGRLVETLRFHKAGMTLVPPAEGSIVAREADGSMLLELANASAFDYGAVAARVRVLNLDACAIVSKLAPTTSWWDQNQAGDRVGITGRRAAAVFRWKRRG